LLRAPPVQDLDQVSDLVEWPGIWPTIVNLDMVYYCFTNIKKNGQECLSQNIPNQGGNAEALFMSKPGALMTVYHGISQVFCSADLQRGIVIQAHPCQCGKVRTNNMIAGPNIILHITPSIMIL